MAGMTITEVRIRGSRDRNRFTVLWEADGVPQHQPFPDRRQARRFVRVDLVDAGYALEEARRVLGQEAWERYKREHVTDDTALQLGRSLRDAREASGLSLRDVASVSNGRVSSSGLSFLEKGERTAKVSTLEAISEAYGVTFVIADGKTEVRLPGETPWRKPTSRS